MLQFTAWVVTLLHEHAYITYTKKIYDQAMQYMYYCYN